MRYDVFISYSRKDAEIADQICDVLKENGITYFIDTEDISGGEEFSPVLAENIGRCTLFLFLGSKNSYESKWTPKELHFALNHKDNIAIIPYLIDEEPLPEKIEFGIADLNVRNIKAHPIETTLLEDIKTAKEKILQKEDKDDLRMAKTIAESIISSNHERDYCIELLTKLGDANYKYGNGYISPKETLHYFTSALSLLEKESSSVNPKKEERQIASVCSKIANIYYSQEKFDDAVIYLEKAIDIYHNNEDFSWINGKLVDNLLWLCEIKIMKEDYEKVEQLCLELKDVLTKSRDIDIDEKALRMSEMYVKTLKAQQKFEQADCIQDDILTLFREQNDNRKFADMLVTFADANILAEQYQFAEKYLKEASELDDDNLEIITKFANVQERVNNIAEAKNTYEKAFRMLMSHPLKGRNGQEFLKIFDLIIDFLDRNNFCETIEKYYKLVISKYNIDIYHGEIESTIIGNIYERYADWLTKHQLYHKSSRYLKMCQEFTRNIKEQDRIASIMFNTLTKNTINSIGLGYKEYALKDLSEALNIYNSMNDEFSYRSHKRLYTLWEKYTEIGFSEGTELIKKSLIKSKTIKIDNLGNKASYYTSLGWFLLLMEEYTQAQQPLEEALKAEQKLKRNDININNAKNNLARLYIGIEKYDKAEVLLNEALFAFEKIIEKNKDALHNFAESQNYLGRLGLKQKRYAEAERYFEQSLENYKKAAKLNKKWEKEVKETSLLLEQVKALQEE